MTANPHEDGRTRPSTRAVHSDPQISAADFPALRSFLRGYFHEDMKDKYGSPEEAVTEFCADASADERTAVANEWARFQDRTKGQPLDQINQILTGPLGSSCRLTDEEVQQITTVLARFTHQAK